MSEREPQKDAPRLVPTSAVLHEAHAGDIHGAFGTIRLSDVAPRRTWRRRILTLAAIIGPGLIVMVGDNDAGGVSTYAQAGQDYGYSLLWTLVLLVPVLIVNQEMVVRLGAVTGVGYARLITERFGRSWGWYSVGNLFLLNFLTISTEFMGVTLGAEYFGFNRYLVVPLAAIVLIAITLSGNFRSWERAMFFFLFASLLVIPLALLSHPSPGAVLRGFLVPGVYGGFTSNAALLIIAVVVVIGAAAIMMATASAFTGNSDFGHFADAYSVARGLHLHISPVVGAIFALLLIDASIVGASAVTLTTSYAFGDMFGRGFSLHRGFREAKLFYGMYAAMVVLAAAIVLIPHAPLGLITTAVQALAGILLPSTTVFAVLLCNDRAVLGPWINRPWLNVLAAIIVGALLLLSLILVISTVVPSVDVTVLLKLLAPLILIVIAVGGVAMWWGSRRAQPVPPSSRSEREGWRMPALTLLERPRSSLVRRFAMLLLGSYVAFAVILLAVKAVQIALGHH